MTPRERLAVCVGGGGGASTYYTSTRGGGGGGGSSYIEPNANAFRSWESWKIKTANGVVLFGWQ